MSMTKVDFSDPEKVFKAFKLRDGTNKARLIRALIKARGDYLPLPALLRAAYGAVDGGDEASLRMIVKGINVAIKENSLPMKVEKIRPDRVLHLTLVYLRSDESKPAGRLPTPEEANRYYDDRTSNQPPPGADAQGNIRVFDKDKVPADVFDFEIIS